MTDKVLRTIVCLCVLLSAGGTSTVQDDELELRAFNAAYDRALVGSDADALDRIYADDFTYSACANVGQLQDRDDT